MGSESEDQNQREYRFIPDIVRLVLKNAANGRITHPTFIRDRLDAQVFVSFQMIRYSSLKLRQKRFGRHHTLLIYFGSIKSIHSVFVTFKFVGSDWRDLSVV
jgi:hypothetical protein